MACPHSGGTTFRAVRPSAALRQASAASPIGTRFDFALLPAQRAAGEDDAGDWRCWCSAIRNPRQCATHADYFERDIVESDARRPRQPTAPLPTWA
jgi:hypothetical protein